MAGRIPNSVKRIYIKVVSDPRHRDFTVEEIHAVAGSLATESGERQPSVEWAYRFLRPFKKSAHWLDEPWSIATLDRPDFDMNVEALFDVIGAWRWAFVRGRKLTNREVRWASRIHGLFSTDDQWFYNFMLASHAINYARMQSASEILGEPFNTSRYDLELVMFHLRGNKGDSKLSDQMLETAIQTIKELDGLPAEDLSELASTKIGGADPLLGMTLFPFEDEPAINLAHGIARRDQWSPPTDVHMDLLILGVRRLVRSDSDWTQLRDKCVEAGLIWHGPEETYVWPPLLADDELVKKCESDVRELIKIIDTFSSIVDADPAALAAEAERLWDGADWTQGSSDHSILKDRMNNQFTNVFLRASGGRS